MNHYNYITGEPLGPSPVSQSFTDPNERYQQMTQMQEQQANSAPVQVPGRVYAFGGGGYNGGGYGSVGSPYFNGMNPPIVSPYYQQPKYVDRVTHIDGYNPRGSKMLLPENYEEICDQMQIEMEIENEQAIARRNARYQGVFNYNGSTYYGWNNGPDQAVLNKYRSKVNEMRAQAMEKMSNLNKRLSRLAHNNIAGDEVTDDQINQLYDGYDIKTKAAEAEYNDKQKYLDSLKPVTNRQAYVKNFENLQKVYKDISGGDMESFLAGQGVLQICDNMETELHSRRDYGQLYDSNSFRRLLKKSIMEREGIKPSDNQVQGLNLPQFSTLAQSSKLLDDGTLTITPPSWIGGRSFQFNNEMEAHFEENRNKFLQSIYAQDNQYGDEELPFK